MYESSGENTQTAFRKSEKKYQLHKDQVIKYKNGRPRGKKLQLRPTDVSDVVDLLDDAHQEHRERLAVAHACTPFNLTIYSFPERPGLYVIPGALSPSQQRKVITDALTRFPQPPNHTNFISQYGLLPAEPSLWDAVQRGLYLQPRQVGAASTPASHATGKADELQEQGHQQVLGDEPTRGLNPPDPVKGLPDTMAAGPAAPGSVAARSCQAVERLQGKQTATPAAAPAVASLTTSLPLSSPPLSSPATAPSSPPSPPPPAAPAAPTDNAASVPSPCANQGHLGPLCGEHDTMMRSAQEALQCCARWVRGDDATPGRGVAARKLLRKLRWATLGPPFDWTRRVYRHDVQYSPLPQYLADLAVQLARAVSLVGLEAKETTDLGGYSSRVASADGASFRSFQPDVALVNYYHEGDTLGGHVDDAELDLHQPIVTVSLGCEAVFLAGGLTRDVPPLPLLLRSGDAVVMAGESRKCYHGVPRIFTDRPLPPQLLEDILGPPGELPLSGMAREGGQGAGHAQLHGRVQPWYGEGPRDNGAVRAGGAAEGGQEAQRSAGEGLQFAPLAEHMQRCRINVSIRAVT